MGTTKSEMGRQRRRESGQMVGGNRQRTYPHQRDQMAGLGVAVQISQEHAATCGVLQALKGQGNWNKGKAVSRARLHGCRIVVSPSGRSSTGTGRRGSNRDTAAFIKRRAGRAACAHLASAIQPAKQNGTEQHHKNEDDGQVAEAGVF